MIPNRSTTPRVLSFLALLGTVLGLSAQSALARPTSHARHVKKHHHHTVKPKRHHRGSGIGPGGDGDSDNHGAASDGDGNL